MKYIQVIDGALNCVYDVYAVSEAHFEILFPKGTDIAFIDEVIGRSDPKTLEHVFMEMWSRRIPKAETRGIHGTLFFELEQKKIYYPTRKDEEAINPDGSKLRPGQTLK